MVFRFLGFLFSLAALVFVGGAVAVAGAVWWYGRDLPEYEQLADYKPPELSRVLNDDGGVIARFAREARIVVPIEEVPPLVRNAFVSAEDKNFYSHRGIDPVGIAKAVVRNARAAMNGQRLSGASTITQQVVKNLLLTNERSISRKIREAVLAVQLERELSKDRILELYLNQIYFGARAHGIGAASQIYFNKKLQYLAPEEVAFLAALPKAPSALNPVRNRDRATARRNYVLREMVENGYLTPSQGNAAIDTPLETRLDEPKEQGEAGYDWASAYMIEEVRGRLLKTFADRALAEGATAEEAETQAEERLYGGGLTIRTTLDAELQGYAAKALRDGLFRYEKGNGYRGAVARLDPDGPWRKDMAELDLPRDLGDWRYALVIRAESDTALIGIEGEDRAVELSLEAVAWGRTFDPQTEEQGPEPKRVDNVLSRGDVIVVGPVEDEDGETAWELRQLPQVNGAVMAMEVETGRIVAMQGGYSAQASDFNRVTQAQRQPGSAFKPIVYAAAFDNGYTPASIVLDAPVTVDQGNDEGLWRPGNYAERFYGPTPMRIGLEKSRNLITVRVAQDIGMDTVADYAQRLGIYDNMPALLSFALGAGETTMLRMVTGYATFVNGGRRVTPLMLDDLAAADGSDIDLGVPWVWSDAAGEPEQVIDPVTAYQTVSLMEGVVQRGTATKLTRLGFPVAGKTGTTNDERDAWFVGFTPELVFGCYVGYDTPKPMGKRASGGAMCGPVFEDFMRNAMVDRTPRDFERPEGVELVKINRFSGRRVGDDVFGKDVIWEAFRTGTAPTEYETSEPTRSNVSFFPPPEEQPSAQGNRLPPQPQRQPDVAPYEPPTARAPAPAPFDPNEPLIRIDPVTGQIIVAQDPSVSVAPSPNVIYAPSGQAVQPQQPVQRPRPPAPQSGVGNSTQDLQDGRGLY